MADPDSLSERVSKKRPTELTVRDFSENDLPHRPLRFRPEYRQDVRHFVFICGGVVAFVFGLTFLHLL
ncbi:MAG: hypothetical protein ACQETB_04345 [Halobacteriota archaeon]